MYSFKKSTKYILFINLNVNNVKSLAFELMNFKLWLSRKLTHVKWIILPVMCNQNCGVTTIGGSVIPMHAIIDRSHLVTIVLLEAIAKLTIQTWSWYISNSYSFPYLELWHNIASNFNYYSTNFIPKITNIKKF